MYVENNVLQPFIVSFGYFGVLINSPRSTAKIIYSADFVYISGCLICTVVWDRTSHSPPTIEHPKRNTLLY
jgi:hypothetical protein